MLIIPDFIIDLPLREITHKPLCFKVDRARDRHVEVAEKALISVPLHHGARTTDSSLAYHARSFGRRLGSRVASVASPVRGNGSRRGRSLCLATRSARRRTE